MKIFDELGKRSFPRKAQIQSLETIAVLLIFFVLIFLGVIYFTKFMHTGAQETITKFEELSRIQSAQIVSSLPELQCSEDNIIKSNCIDLLKLGVAPSIIDSPKYFDLFANSKIMVEEIYPNLNNWTLYHRIPKNEYRKDTNFFPISLFNPITNTYSFGLIYIETYKEYNT